MNKKMNKKKKLEKKELKEVKKIRSNVKKTFPLKNKIPDSLVNAVRLNRVLMKKDDDRNKVWRDEYYQKLFIKFKELVEQYNGGLNSKTDKLIKRVDALKQEVIFYENKLNKLKEVSKLLD